MRVVLGAHGVDRTGDHTDRAEDEQHIADAQRTDHVKADDAHIYLDQQEDIALGNDAGEHRGSARRAVGIGSGQPLVKREQRALHRKTHADEADHHRQRHVILAARRQRDDALVDVDHQQMAGNRVENDDADEEQARTEQVHHHVSHARDQRAPVLAHHHQARRRQRVDFDEHVSGEQVVGVDQRNQRKHGQIRQDAIDIILGRLDLLLRAAHAAEE